MARLFQVLAVWMLWAPTAFSQASVSISNLNRSESPTAFFDGDQFQIALTHSAPNAGITVDLYRNGALYASKVPLGSTDATGAYQSSGFFFASLTGSWSEVWYVADVPAAAPLAFTVSPLASTPVLTPGSTETEYLYNQNWQFDQSDTYGLPRFLYYVNAAQDPQPQGVPRKQCTLEPNPAGFRWYRAADNSDASGSPPMAAPGQYIQSAQFIYPATQSTGFVFNGEFIGQANAPTTGPGQFYVEAAYITDRPCSDGGTEYGWSYEPAVADVNGNSANQPPNTVFFYYSTFTNCGGSYLCKSDPGGPPIQQKTNTWQIVLQPDAGGTYQYVYQVFRTNPAAASYFVLSIRDPQTGLAAQCSIHQIGSTSTATLLQTTPDCSEVFISIDTSWYPAASVSNSGYVTFAQDSNVNVPVSWGLPYPASNTENQAPPQNVVPTTYPNGTTAPWAGFNIQSAAVIHE